MSQQLISRSADLKRLRDEGYDLGIRSGFLLLKNVPYVSSKKEIQRGVLVSKLCLAGDLTTKPDDHIAYFIGETPCHRDGTPLGKIINQSADQTLDGGLVVNHTFSAKPQVKNGYDDYYDKLTTYAAILGAPAEAINPTVTSKTFPIIEPGEEESVFNYIDTASSRAAIILATRKLELARIAIIGLGGTGSYVLDLVAKTPVREIHLFDGDVFSQHNAFRSPGAPSLDELEAKPLKATYFKALYSKMHRGLVAHETYLGHENVDQLGKMDFVFLCLDRGTVKELIVGKLEEFDIPFVDVGMGVYMTENNSLAGILRVTSSTPQQRQHVRANRRIPFSDGDAHNDYSHNIQIADLNALNAALAVIKWKKLFGFYVDLEHEHHSTYTIDGNAVTNEDQL